MELYDAVIVGAGPAGCAAAYDLASAGHSVALLDRRSFPREKPCAGGLTVKTLRRLRYSIAPVIEYVARDLDVTLRGSGRRRLASRTPICVMTVRRNLDAFCLEKTTARGAEFHVVKDIAAVEETPDWVDVETSQGPRFRGRFLIGADGARSRVRRLGKVRYPPAQAIAVEGLVPLSPAHADIRMRFDFGYLPGGYGWIFPKRDHLNVGLYTQRPGATIGKADVLRYAATVLPSAEPSAIVGYPIGIGGERYLPRSERVLLAGDAAGMTDPLLGEGIHNAIKTGQAAATAIIAALRSGSSASRTLEHALDQEVGKDLRACAGIARSFYGFQSLGFGAMVSQPIRTALMRGFAAGMTLREIARSFVLAPLYPVPPLPDVEAFEAAHAARR